MNRSAPAPALEDLEPTPADFALAVIEGLSRKPPTIPSRFLYDARGSQLFDRICDLPEYYPARTEMGILRGHLGEIIDFAGPEVLLVELGSGSSMKTRLLLDRLASPVAYVPLDISRPHLENAAAMLAQAYPDLEILPVCADYTRSLSLPSPKLTPRRTVLFYPGSTIGNFEPVAAGGFLRHVSTWCAPGDRMIVGIDLHKDRATLEAAYNDKAGVTAAFNLNLLERANRELGADFDLQGFRHEAIYNAECQRIEMRLISLRNQTVELAGHRFAFPPGEAILTEYSHKYSPETFSRLVTEAGWSPRGWWSDPHHRFAVCALEFG